jgi:Fungal hydrophobin
MSKCRGGVIVPKASHIKLIEAMKVVSRPWKEIEISPLQSLHQSYLQSTQSRQTSPIFSIKPHQPKQTIKPPPCNSNSSPYSPSASPPPPSQSQSPRPDLEIEAAKGACHGFFGMPRCCTTLVDDILDINCVKPAKTPTDAASFSATCQAVGREARCCVASGLGFSLVCSAPV